MELVYLWVEGYKNIKKQEFNFSPRFECEFKDEYNSDGTLKDNCELVITPKEHLKNFFGENIYVTAIVGENGSGKSSLLKSILQIDDFDTNYILVYRKNGDNYYYYSTIDIKTDINVGEEQSFNSPIVYLTYQHEHYAFRNYRLVNNDKQAIIDVLVSNEVKNEIFNISTFMYLPTTIEVTYKSPADLINKFINRVSPLDREKLIDFFNALDDYSFHQFLIIKYIENRKTSSASKIYEDEEALKKFFENTIDNLQKTHTEFVQTISTKTFKFNENKEEIELYTDRDYFSYFKFDLIDNRDLRYNHLSSGEQVIFGQLLQIFFYLNGDSPLLFLFDEPEVFLHPQWQKKYLSELMTLFQNKKANAHFIFTSHSPFLLSDLPKENVIFLEKDKETSECINTTKDVNLNPFGANIHTLLSHGFFMQDGLMGEFAKGKINEVYKFLSDDNYDGDMTTDKAEQVIKIIGEPVLQKELQKLFDKNTHIDIDGQIKAHEDEIAKLKAKKEQQ